MGYESIVHEGERNNNCFGKIQKSNLLVKKVSRLNIFRKWKLDINPFLLPKHDKYGGSFSLLVGYNI